MRDRLFSLREKSDFRGAKNLAQEKACQTLQATALVHEANLRIVVGRETKDWNSRGQARRRNAVKRGDQAERVELNESLIAAAEPDEDIRIGN